MFLKYVPIKSIIDRKRGFTSDYVYGMHKRILLVIKDFLGAFREQLKVEGIDFNAYINEDLVMQIVIDTIEDLKRIVDFHPVNHLNLIKEISHLAYWWLRRKPVFVPLNVYNLTSVDEETKIRLLFINEFVLVAFITAVVFDFNKLLCKCSDLKIYEYEWECARKLLFYYLVYRVDSPKNIEQFLVGSILHPVWETNDYFWEQQNNDKT